MQEIKNLVAKDLTGIGTALKRAFDLLNQFRVQTGIDNYGLVC
jgi:integrator complex subunit 6